MLAALILAISIVALFQFALYYWRAILAGALAQPVSQEVRAAAGIRARITGQDFKALSGIHRGIPGRSARLGFVPLYYRMVEAVDAFVRLPIPVIAAWTESERAICAHYVGVQIDRRMQVNRELAARA